VIVQYAMTSFYVLVASRDKKSSTQRHGAGTEEHRVLPVKLCVSVVKKVFKRHSP
jgi:hypothetical protein